MSSLCFFVFFVVVVFGGVGVVFKYSINCGWLLEGNCLASGELLLIGYG